jgi:uncharacterized protein YoxC
MAKLSIKKASTDVTVYVFIQDSSATTGAGLTGLTFETASLVASYVRPLAARAALTLATQTVTGAHSDGGFVEVDATNMPGLYRLDLSDAVCATGVGSVVVMLKGAANMAPLLLEIQLTDFDLNDASPNVTVADIANDAITAAAYDESTAFPVKSADTGATAIARVGADSDTLETLSDQMDAIKTETASILEDTGTTIPGTITTIDNEIAVIDGIVDNILEDTGTTLDTKINTIDDFLDTEVAAILEDTNELQAELADGGRTDLLIDAIKAKTDTITTPPTAASVADAVWDEAIADHTTATTFGGKNQKVVPSETINDYKADVSAITGASLSATGIDAIVDEVIVGTYTMRQLLTVFASALAGKLSGGGTTTLTFRGINDASNVIVATVDANGNRSDLTITV